MSMENKTEQEICDEVQDALCVLESAQRYARKVAGESGNDSAVIAADKFAASVIMTHAKAIKVCGFVVPGATPSFGGK